MSKINLNNYEAFMLDHMEGNLSPQDTLALKAFAVLHPELDLNFDEELATLHTEHISFENKQNIKAAFSDELVIGYLENILEGSEKQEAEKLVIHNTVFKHELELYKRTIAVADTTIVFENKESLKRRGVVILFPQNNYIRVAAALLLLLGLWFMVSRIIKGDVKVTDEMANTEKGNNELKNNVIENNNNTNKSEPPLSNNTNDNYIAKKTNDADPITNKKEINTSTVNATITNEKEERQLADIILTSDDPFIKRDTNSTLMANNSSHEQLSPKYIIEEGLDDEPVAVKEKSKFWNFTSGLLKGLNKRGVENVNSTEGNNEILIGALTISKPN